MSKWPQMLLLGIAIAVMSAQIAGAADAPPVDPAASEVTGCYFHTKCFHDPKGGCVSHLTGFRVLFKDASTAINAGYQPCETCATAYRPNYERKVAAIQQQWRTYIRSVEGAAEMMDVREARASEAGGTASAHAAVAADHSKKAETAYGAAGLALMSGQPSVALRLARRAAAHERISAIEQETAEQWFGEMARQEYLANYNRQYALQARQKYLSSVNQNQLAEIAVEREALQRSVVLLTERGELYDAAMTAGLAWMMAIADADEDYVQAAAETMEKAVGNYKEHGAQDDPAWINSTLSLAWEVGTHGYRMFGIMASYLIMSKYPENSRASSVYYEVCATD